jgi:SprB repeat
MKPQISLRSFSLILVSFIFVIYACSKGGGGTPPPPANPCAGVTVTVSGTVVHPSAPGASNGSIAASATGGSGFTFSINGGAFQSSGNFTGLAAGSYTIVAKNGSGCTGSAAFTLVAPNPCAGITITVTGTVVNPTTGNNNGSITVSASGGAGGFTFNINGGAFQSSGTFSNLGAGTYTIIARDANGCTGSAVFTLVATNPCAGIIITVTGTVTNPSAPGANNGSIAASASGGAGGFTFNINGGTFQASGTFSNLVAGNYTISAKDVNGCTGSAVFTLTDPNPCAGVTITMTTTTSPNVPCMANNGSITITPAGGTAPYTFSLNGGAFQSSNMFNNLAAGNYSLVVRDVNNCSGNGNAAVGTASEGPLFSQVKVLIQNNCAVSGCHAGTQSPDFRIDCNIVSNGSLIQQRAVFGNPSPMPPTGLLSASERQKITNWINAGGRFSD